VLASSVLDYWQKGKPGDRFEYGSRSMARCCKYITVANGHWIVASLTMFCSGSVWIYILPIATLLAGLEAKVF
jgi:hypothetical protein